MNPVIPTPETVSAYERLGNVGILLLVLFFLGWVIFWSIRRLSKLAAEAFTFVREQTTALSGVKDALEGVKDASKEHIDATVRLHERLDMVFSCARAGCPLFELRKKQQAEAAQRFPQTTTPHQA